MKKGLTLPFEKKLTVIVRVESGCLGPQGHLHVEEFCLFGQPKVEPIDAEFVHWILEPRANKSESETEYLINNKKLTHQKALRYMHFFKKDLALFEEHLHARLADLIEEYFDTHPTAVR